MEFLGFLSGLWLLLLLATNLAFAVFVGWVAGEAGRSVLGWFFASFFFSPLIALLGLIAVKQ